MERIDEISPDKFFLLFNRLFSQDWLKRKEEELMRLETDLIKVVLIIK